MRRQGHRVSLSLIRRVARECCGYDRQQAEPDEDFRRATARVFTQLVQRMTPMQMGGSSSKARQLEGRHQDH
jgi:hypothetical protein